MGHGLTDTDIRNATKHSRAPERKYQTNMTFYDTRHNPEQHLPEQLAHASLSSPRLLY